QERSEFPLWLHAPARPAGSREGPRQDDRAAVVLPAFVNRPAQVLPQQCQIDAALGVHRVAAVELDHFRISARTSDSSGRGSCQSHAVRSQKPGSTSLRRTPRLARTGRNFPSSTSRSRMTFCFISSTIQYSFTPAFSYCSRFNL